MTKRYGPRRYMQDKIYEKVLNIALNKRNANSNCAKIVFVTYQIDNHLSFLMCTVGEAMGNQAM